MSRLSARIKFLIRALGVNGYIIRLVIARSVLMRAVKLRLPVSELLAIVDGAIEQNNRFYRRTNYSDWQSLYAPTDFFGRGFPPSVGVTVVVCPRRSSLSHLYKSLRSIERERSPAIDVVVLSTGPWSDFLLGMAAYAAGGAKSVIIRRPTDLEGLLRERVALIQGAPVLRPGALGALNASMDKDPSTRAVYADEDRTIGKRVDFPQFKPDFSPVLGQQYDYVGNVILFTREFFLSNVLPDVRINAIPSWIGDRSLPQGAVVHLPQVLHSEQTRRRLTHISGAEFDQELAMTIQNEAQRPSVAIIIPTRDREELLRSCIQGIDECTDYDASRISIIIVDNGTVEPAAVHLLSQLEARHNFSVVKRPGEFNYSWLCNQGAAAAAADILVFMNNDIVLRDRNWLGKLVSAVSLPSVGVVGCKLLYPSGKIQHAGVILGIHGLAGHIGVGANEFDGGYLNLAKHTRELSAVTGALVAVRRSVFQAAGGYDERLAIAFSDIALCLTCNGLGFQTLCLQSALAFHLESASRGDDTLDPLKHIRLLEECLQVLSTHGSLKIDPFYNPNLSLIGPYELADPPRLVARTNLPNRAPRVLMLSWTFQVGHGVAVVVDIQARALESMGCVVFIGAPVKANEIPWPKNRRLDVSDENTAAKLAAELNFDVVMVHTPPFFSVFKVLPMNISGIAYDYGEPPPSLFPDTVERRLVDAEKFMSMAYADRVLAISEVVRTANALPTCEILPLGNTHLAQWNAESVERRMKSRLSRNWPGQLVILNVCRFTEAERAYKGVDFYINLRRALDLLHPDIGAMTRFVLAGRALREDVDAVSAGGIDVIANPSDEGLADLYHAADLYLSASRWEGYNLGIAQALAMGLPVCASDIPAHRAFGVPVFTSLNEALSEVVQAFRDPSRREGIQARQPILRDWKPPAERLRDLIDELVLDKQAENRRAADGR